MLDLGTLQQGTRFQMRMYCIIVWQLHCLSEMIIWKTTVAAEHLLTNACKPSAHACSQIHQAKVATATEHTNYELLPEASLVLLRVISRCAIVTRTKPCNSASSLLGCVN